MLPSLKKITKLVYFVMIKFHSSAIEAKSRDLYLKVFHLPPRLHYHITVLPLLLSGGRVVLGYWGGGLLPCDLQVFKSLFSLW